jgi:hypothetical protein
MKWILLALKYIILLDKHTVKTNDGNGYCWLYVYNASVMVL